MDAIRRWQPEGSSETDTGLRKRERGKWDKREEMQECEPKGMNEREGEGREGKKDTGNLRENNEERKGRKEGKERGEGKERERKGKRSKRRKRGKGMEEKEATGRREGKRRGEEKGKEGNRREKKRKKGREWKRGCAHLA